MFPVRFETFSFPFHEFMVAAKVLFFVGQSSIMKLSNLHAKILKTLGLIFMLHLLCMILQHRGIVSHIL